MASANKFDNKNKMRMSVNDEDRSENKFNVSSSRKKFAKLSKDKISPGKIKDKNSNYLNTIESTNFSKSPNFNISTKNNNNNFDIINKKFHQVLNFESKHLRNNITKKFGKINISLMRCKSKQKIK